MLPACWPLTPLPSLRPQEVRPRTPASEQKLKTLECFALLATKSKANSEKALGRLMDMATNQVHVTVM